MHHLPLNCDPSMWEDWNGPLTKHIDGHISKFLAELIGQDSIPDMALYIAQLSLADGGLSLLKPGNRAAPDYVITMTQAMRFAGQGIKLHPELEPIYFHPSISELYLPAFNPKSFYLQRFNLLLPHIANVACARACPTADRTDHFLTKVSSHSARSYIKKHCSSGQVQSLYSHVESVCPEHLHHLPSVLTPHMSLPLIAMCRSVPSNRLTNSMFLNPLLRKLRLPVFDPTDLPTCWCKETHDCFGDHCFGCKENNKKFAHNFIVNGVADGLQKPLATAGYIQKSSNVIVERPHLMPSDLEARPLDLSFEIDPDPTETAPASCPFNIIGGDITITGPPPAKPLSDSVDSIELVTANAEANLQKKERLKLMRDSITDAFGTTIFGDELIGELVKAGIVLIPMAIDPHGRLGPMFMNFLFNCMPRVPVTFRNNRYYAGVMYDRAVNPPCPTGILTTASIKWQQSKPSTFYGHSYTAPTPKEYTMGRIGLTITKAFALQIRNANQKFGTKPPRRNIVNSPQTNLDSFH